MTEKIESKRSIKIWSLGEFTYLGKFRDKTICCSHCKREATFNDWMSFLEEDCHLFSVVGTKVVCPICKCGFLKEKGTK